MPSRTLIFSRLPQWLNAPIAAGLVLLAGSFVGAPQAAQAQITVDILISSAASANGPHYQDLDDAIKRFRVGDVEAARALLAAARKKAPKLAPVETMLATLYLSTNQGPAARAELEKAIRGFPDDPEAYVRLAEVATSEGRLTEAALVYQKALEVVKGLADNPKRKKSLEIRANSGAGVVDENREQWKAACDHLEALAKLEPENSVVQLRLAKALFKLGDPKASLRALQAAGQIDKATVPELNMAIFYNQANDKVNAEKWMNLLTKKGDESFAAHYGLGNWLLQTSQLDEARSHAEAAVKLDPQNPDAKRLLGIVARMQKDQESALPLLEAAHLQSPTNTEVLNQLALLLIEKDDDASHKRAVEYAELNSRLYPNNVEAAATLAWIDQRTGKTAASEQLFSAVAGSGLAMSSDAAYFVANYWKEHGKIAEASRILETVLSRDATFFYRREAQSMLQQLSKAAQPPASNGTPKPAPKQPDRSGSK